MTKAFWRVALMALLCMSAAQAQPAAPLRLVAAVPLPHVHGRIDHFDVDLVHRRLLMSALGNNTLEIFDLRANKLIHTISGLREPQGVTYAPKSNRIFVANGDDGTVRMFDGDTYKQLNIVDLQSDADDTRYESATDRVFVGFGGGKHAGIGVLDGTSGKLLKTIKLPGHPESFQLEESGSRIFVNVPTAGNKVAVVNRTDGKILAMWSLGGAEENFPMALDEKDHRLFIASRAPAEVLVLDTESGKLIASVPGVGHADDMWYGGAHKRIYVSGGSGFISVIQQEDVVGRYSRIAQIRTAPGGRTSCFVPELNRLYLGVWGRGNQPEALRVYEVGP